MKNNQYFRNIALTVLLGLALAVCTVIRAFAPYAVLPRLDVPNMVLISLAALLIDRYLAPGARRCYICIPLLAAATFGLLPFAACFVGLTDALWLALKGGVAFTATTWLFDTMNDRMSSGPVAKAAPFVSALCLYLAAQCLMGIV